jgi:hypothetical protein
MIVVMILTLGYSGSVFYEIWVIDHNKEEILTLYSYLRLSEIREVF